MALVRALLIAVGLIWFFSVDPDEVAAQMEAAEKARLEAERAAASAAA